MRFNNQISMKDLFQNKEIENILPQFRDGDLKNVQSFEWVNGKVKEYIKTSLNGEIKDGQLYLKGKKLNVLQSLQRMKYTLEAFFNAIPSIVKNIRHNTKLYLPFSNMAQIKSLRTDEQKVSFLNMILDNVNYNPDFRSLNDRNIDIYNSGIPFEKRQAQWAEIVGYWRNKLW